MDFTEDDYNKKSFFSYKYLIMAIFLVIAILFAYNYFQYYRELERIDAYGNTPLMEAVKLGDFRRVGSYIKRGADVNIPDFEGYTPLMVALKMNQHMIADILFENDADVHVKDSNNNSPLLLAVKSDFKKAVNDYIEKGADINLINNLGEHPLTVALEKGNTEIIKLLMDNGSDIVVQPIGVLEPGSVVSDITATWRFRDGMNYSGRTTKDAPVEWLVIAQNHFGEDKTLMLTKEVIAKHVFDSSFSTHGGRDSWHNSRLRTWMINVFYRSLSSGFKGSIEPVETFTGGLAIPDEKVFLLSQVELNLGRRKIIGNHGRPVEYFEIPDTRIAYFDNYSWYYWTRSAEAYVDEEYADEYYKARYRVRYVAAGGEISSEYPLMGSGGVRPATNLNSEVLVTTYVINGTHVIVWATSDMIRPYL